MDSKVNHTNRVNYLIKVARLLPSENYYQRLLKSYYLTNCKRLTQSDENHSNTLFSEEEMCKRCSTSWVDTNFSLSIAPIKTTQRKARKIHKQIEEKSKRKSHLAKKLSKRVNNTVTTKCNLCNNKSKVILWKKAPVQKKSIVDDVTKVPQNDKILSKEVPKPQSVVSSKKKRKKDKNAGLLYSIDKSDNSVKKIDINKKIQFMNIQRAKNDSQQHGKKAIQKKKNKNAPQNQSKGQSMNNLGKIKKNIAKPQPIMKRSNLLQLAQALKTKSNLSSSNSQNDKLKQLLR